MDADKKTGRAKTVTYKGKEILFLDLSGIKAADLDMSLDAMKEMMALVSQRPKSSVLTLTYVKDGSFNRATVKALKNLAKHDKPYVKKGAVVGLEGIQKVIYVAVMKFSKRNLPVFGTIEEAEEWLIKD